MLFENSGRRLRRPINQFNNKLHIVLFKIKFNISIIIIFTI